MQSTSTGKIDGFTAWHGALCMSRPAGEEINKYFFLDRGAGAVYMMTSGQLMTIIHFLPVIRSGRTSEGEALGSEHRREREKEQRRNTILRAARKEFFEKGFRSVTVDSIARRSELSKGAIYLYFKSKEEIYAQILLRDIDKFHDRVDALLDTSKSASDNLRQYAEVYAAFFFSDRELFRIFMNFMIQHNPVHFTPNINDHIVKSTNQTVIIIEQILQMGVDRGEFPKESQHPDLPQRPLGASQRDHRPAPVLGQGGNTGRKGPHPDPGRSRGIHKGAQVRLKIAQAVKKRPVRCVFQELTGTPS